MDGCTALDSSSREVNGVDWVMPMQVKREECERGQINSLKLKVVLNHMESHCVFNDRTFVFFTDADHVLLNDLVQLEKHIDISKNIFLFHRPWYSFDSGKGQSWASYTKYLNFGAGVMGFKCTSRTLEILRIMQAWIKIEWQKSKDADEWALWGGQANVPRRWYIDQFGLFEMNRRYYPEDVSYFPKIFMRESDQSNQGGNFDQTFIYARGPLFEDKENLIQNDICKRTNSKPGIIQKFLV